MRKAMTPEQAHEAWLADMNHHKALGGWLETSIYGGWEKTGCGPCWDSNPNSWRKAPLPRRPRMQPLLIAYRWADGRFYKEIIVEGSAESFKRRGWAVTEITVTEELK